MLKRDSGKYQTYGYTYDAANRFTTIKTSTYDKDNRVLSEVTRDAATTNTTSYFY